MADLGKGDYGIDTDFYEADINVDAILGCPWTKRNRLGIFPYLDALSLERGGGQLDLLKTAPPIVTSMVGGDTGSRKGGKGLES